MNFISTAITVAIALGGESLTRHACAATRVLDTEGQPITLEAGHASLQKWRLPATVPHPADNPPTPPRVELGKKLFFDPRLSGDGNISCSSCHNPMFGWSDGLPTGRGARSAVLGRASPTLYNTAYNSVQMWDGRKTSLEDQAMSPMQAVAEMNTDTQKLFAWLNANPGYRGLFEAAYPGQAIGAEPLSKAIASFERTIVGNHTPFDQWVAGKQDALTPDQVKGFALFIDPNKANCTSCHSGANFTDNSFHNLGLASFGNENPDLGRYAERPVASLKGAFKTPTVREAVNTAPYFHDGSAKTLAEVVSFYVKGGVVKTNLSKSMKELALTPEEQGQLVSFMKALSSPAKPFTLPVLPH
ncbi:MAG: cytochrome c peroxidase [Burkholderiaceae bacterium]